jgi:tetratricopeptide (TPR) repeat protein
MAPIGKEDYMEPRCLLCEEPYGAEAQVKPVPQQRIMEKVDEYMSRRDYAGVERHLLYWLEEAKLGHDQRGELMIRNELVGHYRKTGDREKAFLHAEAALKLLDALGFEGTITAGTTCVNAATAYQAFGEPERAFAIFERARKSYEAIPALKAEAREKLARIRPVSIGQASRISGVSPADVAVLMVWLEQNKNRQ